MTDEGSLFHLIRQPCGLPPSPLAVPDKIFGLTLSLDFIDRGAHCACALSATGSAQARGLKEKAWGVQRREKALGAYSIKNERIMEKGLYKW